MNILQKHLPSTFVNQFQMILNVHSKINLDGEKNRICVTKFAQPVPF